jgi:hypothetical protein
MMTKSSVSGRATSFVLLVLNDCSCSMTYERIQEDIETSSCVHLRKVHHSIQLERSNFKTSVVIFPDVNVRKLLVKFMLFLRDL